MPVFYSISEPKATSLRYNQAMSKSFDLEQYWSDMASILVRMKRFYKEVVNNFAVSDSYHTTLLTREI